MITTQLSLLASASHTVAQTTTPADPISFQTALLVIVTAALLFLAKNLFHLKSRLATLEAGNSTAPFPVPAPRTPVESTDVVRPEVVAAISAAVHITLQARHRIISVGEICPNRQAWSAEGRRQVFSSHKVR